MKTLGIVGGGQLALMMAQAAKTLGIECVVLDPTPECPASAVARQVVGDFHDHATVLAFAKEAEVLTFEIESANADALAELAAQGLPVHPMPETLALIKDKLAQKNFLSERGIPVAPYQDAPDEEAARAAGEVLGYPFLLKARSGGYDGRGNATINTPADIAPAFAKLGTNLYAEGFVSFEKELAVVAVRTVAGDIRTYPVVETVHERHICLEVLAPAPVKESVRKKAETLAHYVLESFSGAGVFAIEMFMVDGDVLVNEIAPRVHNSGHLTIEGCATSQFENHVRAVMGMELGSTELIAPAAVMLNILGERTGPATPVGVEDAKALGGVAIHIYGKKETKPDRKMGHITAVANSLLEARAKAEDAWRRVSI
ncbi:MAG TPA: 5-(carboxyamino)imidazole ribonucleotide synthase [Candidatus Paceibacterota bacterium]|nr:5-(carboxyamino)imidazole ribonucleotide synthase [Candidatus Paceibacterota bacterium]